LANLGARQVKTPKLLLTDTGLAAALVGVDAARYSAPDQGGVAGGLFETFVVMELIKQATWSATPVEVFFYRDTEKREVDLVIESASGDVAAIEAKSAAVVTASDARGLRLLRDKLGPRFKTGIVVYSGEHTLPIDDRIWALPISGLWQ
jgi:predicted AAA+ superfamily ATPase